MAANRIIPVLVLLFLPTIFAPAQVVVKDKKHRQWSKVLQEVQTTAQVINTRVTAFVGNIRDIQEFMSKAATVVNGVIKNIRMIRKIVEMEKEIAQMVNEAIDVLNTPRDEDGDGIDDLDVLDKWKQAQILLAIASEAANVFELFKHVIEKDATIMDDKGRLTLIKDAYKDALRIKGAIRTQLRRINREMYQYQRLKKEIQVYEAFFEVVSS